MDGTFTRLQEFVAQATGGASLRSIAQKTGMEPSTLSRQFARRAIPVETVIAITRVYNGDLLLGLVLGGFITPEEAAGFTGRGALVDATDLQLAQETLRRMRANPSMELDEGSGSLELGLVERRALLDAVAGPHLETYRFAPDAAASASAVSMYDEATAAEDLP